MRNIYAALSLKKAHVVIMKVLTKGFKLRQNIFSRFWNLRTVSVDLRVRFEWSMMKCRWNIGMNVDGSVVLKVYPSRNFLFKSTDVKTILMQFRKRNSDSPPCCNCET